MTILLSILSAASTGDSLSSILPYVNLGMAGIMVGLFLTGKIRRGVDYEEEKARNMEQDKYLKDIAIPLVIRLTDALANNTELLVKLAAERERRLEENRDPPRRGG